MLKRLRATIKQSLAYQRRQAAASEQIAAHLSALVPLYARRVELYEADLQAHGIVPVQPGLVDPVEIAYGPDMPKAGQTTESWLQELEAALEDEAA